MLQWWRSLTGLGSEGRLQRPPYMAGKLENADLQAAADIHAQSFRDAWGDGTLAGLLRGPGAGGIAVRVAGGAGLFSHRIGGALAGFLLYRFAAGECEIITLAVARDHRGRGAGRVMLSALRRMAVEEDLEELFLEVEATNTAALSLYRSAGFRQVGERKGYYRNASAENGRDGSLGDAGRGDPGSGHALVMRLGLKD